MILQNMRLWINGVHSRYEMWIMILVQFQHHPGCGVLLRSHLSLDINTARPHEPLRQSYYGEEIEWLLFSQVQQLQSAVYEVSLRFDGLLI